MISGLFLVFGNSILRQAVVCYGIQIWRVNVCCFVQLLYQMDGVHTMGI